MIKVRDIKVIDDSLNMKSRDRQLEDVNRYLDGIGVLHDGECYLHNYFMKEYKKCIYLSWIYNLVWRVNTYEIELSYIAKINKIPREKLKKTVLELTERYYNEESALDMILEDVVALYNKVEDYELDVGELHYI